MTDQPKVHLRQLNAHYGLPEGTITDEDQKLHPTLPLAHVRDCQKASGHLGSLPHEKQAILVAALSVMQHAHSSQLNKNYQIDPNAPKHASLRHYGDDDFRGLPSFKNL